MAETFSGTTILDGSSEADPVLITGSFNVSAGTTLELQGYIQDAAALAVGGSSGSPGEVLTDGTVTLFGLGSLGLNGGADSIVTGLDGNAKLINQNDTIDGTGLLGGGQLSIDNQSGGEIASNLSGAGITIDTGGGTFTNEGWIIANGSGGFDIKSAIDNTAVWTQANPDFGIEAQEGTINLEGAVTGAGSAVIDGGNIVFESSSTNNVIFVSGAGGTLGLADPADFTGSIRGLAVGDTIHLTNTVVTTAEWDGATLTLNGAPTAFTISGLSASDTFFFTSDQTGGTDLTVETAPAVVINAIDGNDIINASDAAADIHISGTASDSSIALTGQSITVDILDGSNALADSYTTTIAANGTWTVDVTPTLAHALADGTYTVTANLTNAAVDPSPEASQTVTVDEDQTETPTLAFVNTDIGAAHAGAATFTVGGLESDDTAVITFTDAGNNTATATVTANGVATVDLSHLVDGTITAAMAVTDTAGNSFAATSSNSATLDQDTTETPTLAFVNTDIGAAHAGAATFTVGGLESDDTAVITFTDAGNNTATATVTANGVATVDLSHLVDGTITAAMAVTDTAGNSFAASSSNSATLDQDATETPTLAFVNTDIGAAHADAATFTVGGLESDDTAVITFTDAGNNTATATVTANGVATVDLSHLVDGTITAAMAVTDTAGNSFAASSSNSATLDQDATETPTLAFVNTDIGAAHAGAATFTVGGLESDDTAVITFTDAGNNTATATVTANGVATVDLSHLVDGTITAAMAVTDTAGNSFAASSSNSATLDQDATETPTLAFVNTDIGAAHADAATFTVGGLESDDTAVITFTDAGNNTATATVTANGVATVDLSHLVDGTITAAMAVTDTAGNSFAATSSNSATLDQDATETPTLAFVNTDIGAAHAGAATFTVGGLESDDTAVITFTDAGNNTATATVTANGVATVDLSHLVDGTITAAMAVTDTAGNSFAASSSNSATLDQDATETPTLAFVNTDIGAAHADAATFTVGGLESDDTAVITFTDAGNNTATATVTANGVATVDLSHLVDGAITAAMAVTDTAGNSFAASSSNSATLDQDATETPTLAFVNTDIGAAHAGAATFTVGGLESDDTAVITFTDAGNNTATATVTANGVATVDLSHLVDGTITAAMAVTDTAGNSFAASSSNSATLDQDTTETPSVTVDNGSTTPIGSAGASAVALSVGGLSSDDSGALTFSDGTHSVVVTITDGAVVAGTDNTTATVDLSSLAENTTITSTLSLTDTAGNSFAASGNAVTVVPPAPSNFISFSGGTINTNGNVTPQIGNGGSTLQLTDGNLSEAGSWFATNKVSVASFTASFDYQATGDFVDPGALADGTAFILQNDPRGSQALGAAGSSLGYGGDVANGITAISPSAAVELNLVFRPYAGHQFRNRRRQRKRSWF